jgi:hypothetical protein
VLSHNGGARRFEATAPYLFAAALCHFVQRVHFLARPRKLGYGGRGGSAIRIPRGETMLYLVSKRTRARAHGQCRRAREECYADRRAASTSNLLTRAVVTADLNGDGERDLATANTFGNDVSVRVGNGAGLTIGKTEKKLVDLPLVPDAPGFHSWRRRS